MQIPMWKIHMLGSDNHTNMHKYTDRLINSEVGLTIRSKENPIEQYKREIFRGMFYVLYLCAFLRSDCVYAIQRQGKHLTKGKR